MKSKLNLPGKIVSLLTAIFACSIPAFADDDWALHQDNSVKAFTSGNLQQAETELKIAIELAKKAGKTSNVISMESNLGTIYRAQKRFDESAKILEQSVAAMKKEPNPDPVPIVGTLNNIGECYRAAGQSDKGLPALLEAKSMLSESNGLYSIVLQNLGMTYAALNKDSEAEVTFKKAIEIGKKQDPSNAVESMYSLCALYAKQGRNNDLNSMLHDAIAFADRTLGLRSPRTQKLHAMKGGDQNAKVSEWSKLTEEGFAAIQAEKNAEAIPKYEAALKVIQQINPNSFEVGQTMLELGSAYVSVDPAKGEAILIKAIAFLKEKQPDKQRALGPAEKLLTLAKKAQANAYSDKGEYDKALAQVDKMLADKPNDPDALITRAQILDHAGRQKEAISLLNEMEAKGVADPRLYLERGIIAFKIGNNAQAQRDTEAYCRKANWKSAQCGYMAIINYFSAQRDNHALEGSKVLSEACKSKTSMPWPQPILEYLQSGTTDDDLLAKAKDNDQLTEVHTYIGLSRRLKGDKKSAMEHLEWVKKNGNKHFIEYDIALKELSALPAH